MRRIYLVVLLLLNTVSVFGQLPQLVSDIKPGSVGGFEYASQYYYYSHPFNIVWEHNGYVYFTAVDYSTVPNGNSPTNNWELWRSDGTAGGTSIVKDIYPGNTGSDPQDFHEINGTLYFTANSSTTGRELWKTDGTNAGTVLVKEITPGSIGGFQYASQYYYYDLTFSSPFSIGNNFYFVANDYCSVPNGNSPSNNYELWKSDGTSAGTSKVMEIHSNTTISSYPGDFAIALGKVFFTANDNTNGRELWVINAAATDVEEMDSMSCAGLG